jgi:DUF4097 and DUF4098 domain-containing protein YvlB
MPTPRPPIRAAARATALARGVACLALAAAALPGAAAAQNRDRDRDRDRETYRIDTTVSVGRGASVDLSLVSGDVIVTAWNRDQVQIKAYSEEIPLRFEHVGSTVRVNTVSGRYRRTGDQRMEVQVPVGTRVEASSVSGDVSVRGTRGEVEASSVSGDLEVEDVVRRASIHTVSGELRARRLEGDVRARTVSGDLTLDELSGEIDAESVSGEISVRRARSARVRGESVSGEIEYDGTIERDGRYEFQSHSGGVRLVLPSSAAATLDVQTFSGSIDSDFPMTMGPNTDQDRRSRSRRRMEFTINGGGARISAQTFSGTVSIERASGTRSSNDRE